MPDTRRRTLTGAGGSASAAEESSTDAAIRFYAPCMWRRRPTPEPLPLQALHVVMAFGPERGRPEQERLEEVAPGRSAAERADALQQARAIERRAYELVDPCWNAAGMLPQPEFKRLSREAKLALLAEHPFLPEKTVSRLVSQAHYFHSK